MAGQLWQVGSNTLYTTATQQFTTTGAMAINGLSGVAVLRPGTYSIRLKLWYVPSGAIGSSHVTSLTFSGTPPVNLITSPTHVAFPGWVDLDGILTVTTAGTIGAAIALTTAGDDITTSPASFMEIRPLP